MDCQYTTLWYILLLNTVCIVCQTNLLLKNITPQYDSEMFAQKIREKPHFVMFYAPWCGHCLRLKGTFEQLSEKYNMQTTEDLVAAIAKVDCTKHVSLCSRHNIVSYPTMLFYWYDETVRRQYKGSRDFNSLDKFIMTMTKEGPSLEPEVPRARPKTSRPFELTSETFTNHVARGHHFVNFHAPWCGHCKKLAPVWERLRAEFSNDPVVSIVQVDCTVAKSVCSEQNVKGFPSLIFYRHGQMIEEYSGEREFERLVEFVLDIKVRRDQRFAAIDNDSTITDHITIDKSEPVILESHKLQSGLVAELTPDLFSKSVDISGLTFVLFYAPWCPHCQSLAPTFQSLAELFCTDSSLSFSQIDCAKYQTLCSEQNVRAYPTLALYSAGKQTDAYGGLRTLGAMEVYLMEKRNAHIIADVSQQQQRQYVEQQQAADLQQAHLIVPLTQATFHLRIQISFTFINFYQPWCAHCVALEPIWYELADRYKLQPGLIAMATVNCADEGKLCDENGIDRYPTLLLYREGMRINHYTGPRDVVSLSTFVNENIDQSFSNIDTSKLRDEL